MGVLGIRDRFIDDWGMTSDENEKHAYLDWLLDDTWFDINMHNSRL